MSGLDNQGRTKWYNRGWLVVLLLFFIFPIGVIALYLNKNWTPAVRMLLMAVFSAIFITATVSSVLDERAAHEAGYKTAYDYQQAKEQGVSDPSTYYQNKAAHEEQVAQQEEIKRKSVDHSDSAYPVCRGLVKERLISPSSADFPWEADGVWRTGSLWQQKYIVRMHVDSQNAYGATLRSTWRCKVQYQISEKDADPDASRYWELLELKQTG